MALLLVLWFVLIMGLVAASVQANLHNNTHKAQHQSNSDQWSALLEKELITQIALLLNKPPSEGRKITTHTYEDNGLLIHTQISPEQHKQDLMRAPVGEGLPLDGDTYDLIARFNKKHDEWPSIMRGNSAHYSDAAFYYPYVSALSDLTSAQEEVLLRPHISPHFASLGVPLSLKDMAAAQDEAYAIDVRITNTEGASRHAYMVLRIIRPKNEAARLYHILQKE